ncbi:MAG: arylesterase [Acidobacteriota bacterium]|nr:arylesterase [Acidobacteriota bacterium]
MKLRWRALALATLWLPSAAMAVAPASLTVVFLGDSLTAGYGVEEDQAYPAILERQLTGEGHRVRIVNGGMSGDTTAGGLRRLRWLLKQEPDVLVVGLGGNDGLRGLPVEVTEKNLSRIVAVARDQGIEVLLLGMLVPPNYGPSYAEAFAAIFPRLAELHQVDLVPFLLEGVGGVEELNQPDGIHPTVEGQRLVAANVLPYLRMQIEVVSGLEP